MGRDSLSNKNRFEKQFCELQYQGLSISQCFSDFLEFTVAAFVKDEDIYDRIRSKYNDDQYKLFQEMLADLVAIEDEKSVKGIGSDYLGEFYMRFITGGELGQYFTPNHVSDFMAEIVKEEGEYSVLNKKSVNDCACGSGRNLLGGAKAFGQRNIYAIGQDLDRRCCLMAYINLVLSGIDGEIRQGNTIRYDFTDGRSFKLWGGVIPICKKITDLPKYEKVEVVELPKQISLFDL